MFDIKTINKAIEQLAAEKELDTTQIVEAIEAALASAYKKEYNKRGEVVRCALNMKDGSTKFIQIKTVVDDTTVRFKEEGAEEGVEPARPEVNDENTEPLLPLYTPERHILLEEARAIKADAQVGDELEFDLEQPTSEFGRIAAQTAKQVVLQKLREIEKDAMRKEFESKIGGLVSGVVQRVERGNVFVDLGKASGIMFYTESIPGERYRIGERLKFFLLSVQDNMRGPNLVLSRSHPRFVLKLFELEVPEVADGTVQVKGVVREAGSRTKIAVYSDNESVDPVGTCVGQRGARVLAVNSEIGSEKIDIIEWSEDMEKFVAASLSPATVTQVELTGQDRK
ncbi:MAG: transcription termination factor NusA, partial [Patescibacteria group bacterium]|nr:transcription termination factor NusA [Patescibacteria group bacterium]